EDSFKIAEKLGNPDRGEIGGALFGFVRLLLIVQDVCDRMVRLAGFIQPIGDRQLQLMRPEPARFAFRYETQPRREELENVGGLRNQELAGFQERRGKRWMFQRRVFEEFHDPGTAEIRNKFKCSKNTNIPNKS